MILFIDEIKESPIEVQTNIKLDNEEEAWVEVEPMKYRPPMFEWFGSWGWFALWKRQIYNAWEVLRGRAYPYRYMKNKEDVMEARIRFEQRS